MLLLPAMLDMQTSKKRCKHSTLLQNWSAGLSLPAGKEECTSYHAFMVTGDE
jgi:hypothetical protein